MRTAAQMLLPLVWLAACTSPAPPRLPSGRPAAVASPVAELLVITDDGVLDPEGREANSLGALFFLNEAQDGPVSVRIEGDFAARMCSKLPCGGTCPTVRGFSFTDGAAVTTAPLPRGAAAGTCLDPGSYRYEVQVGERQFAGSVRVVDCRAPAGAEGAIR